MSQHGGNYKTLNKVVTDLDIDLSKITENRKQLNFNQLKKLHKMKGYPLEEILNGEHPGYKSDTLLKRLINAGLKEYKCEKCGLSTWMNEAIPL